MGLIILVLLFLSVGSLTANREWEFYEEKHPIWLADDLEDSREYTPDPVGQSYPGSRTRLTRNADCCDSLPPDVIGIYRFAGKDECCESLPPDVIGASYSGRFGYKNPRISRDQTSPATGSIHGEETGGQTSFVSKLPNVERSLLEDVAQIIKNNKDYMQFLNNPTFPELTSIVKKMMQEPTQKAIHEQIWKRILAIEDLYNKLYRPFDDYDAKKSTLEFLHHLNQASIDRNLTMEDVAELENKTQIVAYLVQDEVFRDAVTLLEKTYGDIHLHRKSSRATRNFLDNRIFSKRNAPVPPTHQSLDYPPPYDYPGKPQLTDETDFENDGHAPEVVGHSYHRSQIDSRRVTRKTTIKTQYTTTPTHSIAPNGNGASSRHNSTATTMAIKPDDSTRSSPTGTTSRALYYM